MNGKQVDFVGKDFVTTAPKMEALMYEALMSVCARAFEQGRFAGLAYEPEAEPMPNPYLAHEEDA